MNTIKKNYRIFLPILLIIILVLAIVIYLTEYKYNRYVKEEQVKVYQFFSGTRFDYEGKLSKNRKGVIVTFKPQDIKINMDSTPIYYQEKEKVIFPKEMNVVFPIKNYSQYRSLSYLELYFKNNLSYLNTKNFNKNIDYFFLYDGVDLYFFLDTVTIKYNNEEKELSPLSYIKISYQNTLQYYDKKTDKYEIIDLDKEDVIVTNKYMSLNVSADKADYFNENYLLTTKLSYLKTLDELNTK